MKILYPFLAVIALVVIALLGAKVPGGQTFFGIIVPYAAFAFFLYGFIAKVVNWVKSPVPFRIPTTSGQANSLPWIKQNKLDCPSTKLGVVGRMLVDCIKGKFANNTYIYISICPLH